MFASIIFHYQQVIARVAFSISTTFLLYTVVRISFG